MNADVNIPLSLENSHDAEDTQEVNNTGVERRNSVEVTMNRNKEATEKSAVLKMTLKKQLQQQQQRQMLERSEMLTPSPAR